MRVRKAAGVLCVLTLVAAACHRSAPRGAQPFDRNVFITYTLQSLLANNDLGAMAAHRGRLPETRQLGATIHREHKQLFDTLSAIAQRKGVAIPQGVEEKKVALKENLAILPGQVFDRAYALAMLQDFDVAIRNFRAASKCGDRDIESFAAQSLPLLTNDQRATKALLDSLGGSPFG